jgi:hypothetical protein
MPCSTRVGSAPHAARFGTVPAPCVTSVSAFQALLASFGPWLTAEHEVQPDVSTRYNALQHTPLVDAAPGACYEQTLDAVPLRVYLGALSEANTTRCFWAARRSAELSGCSELCNRCRLVRAQTRDSGRRLAAAPPRIFRHQPLHSAPFATRAASKWPLHAIHPAPKPLSVTTKRGPPLVTAPKIAASASHKIAAVAAAPHAARRPARRADTFECDNGRQPLSWLEPRAAEQRHAPPATRLERGRDERSPSSCPVVDPRKGAATAGGRSR